MRTVFSLRHNASLFHLNYAHDQRFERGSGSADAARG
jgi:hypothetical protein